MNKFDYRRDKSIKKSILLLLVWLALGMIWADTVLLSPTGPGGFESGSTFAANGWGWVGNDTYYQYYNNQYMNGSLNHYVVGTIPGAHAGNRCAYIDYYNKETYNYQTYNQYYWKSRGYANYSHIYRDVILGSSAEPVVTLTFWYKINNTSGDADNGHRGPTATNGDGFRIYLQDTTDPVPTTGGYPENGVQIGAWWYDGVTSWLDGTIYSNGFNARGWTRMVVSIPHTMVGQTKRLVFTWRNDGESPQYVGALDSISLVSKPLPANPRFVAQWEQARGACINWDYYYSGGTQGNRFGVPDGLIKALADTLPLFVHCDPEQVRNCSDYLTGTVRLDPSKFIIRQYPTDSYFIRCHAPWFIFHGDQRSGNRSLGITRFTYNRDRPWDDHVSIRIAEDEGYRLFCMPLVHSGGNIMTDGNGAAMSTNLVRDNNNGEFDADIDHVVDFDYTEAQIKQIMQAYLGVEDYQIFDDPIPDDIFTIDRMDTWCKLLDVDRVIIRRVPPSHPDYNAIEAQAALWNNKVTSYQREATQAGIPGSPYGFKVFRVDTPNDEPYTNSLIMNSTIYVPQMSNPPSANDLAAIEAYQNAMPSYKVLGFPAKTTDLWLSTDALHNRVGLLYDPEMIHIWHVPLWGDVPEDEDINLSINITSTHALNLSTPVTHVSYRIWKAESGSYTDWVDVPLTHEGGNNYKATIPESAFAEGDSILYVIRAKDVNGNEHDEPLNGKHDPFWLHVVGTHGGTTPVELSSFTCCPSVDGFVNLNWVTQTETGLLGYYVYRNMEEDYATAELISPLIPGTNTSQQQCYMYSDRNLTQDGTYYYWLTSNDLDGTVNLYGPVSIKVDSGGSSAPPIEIVTGINKVYPNPFSSNASITYSVAKNNSPVRLSVYNLRGELVRDLVSGVQGKDTYTTTWDCRDQQGKICGNGVYLMVLKAGNESYVKRTILIK